MRRVRSTLVASVPDGWLMRESIELTSLEEEAYVVVSADAVEAGTTAQDIADRYGTLLSERLPGYDEVAMQVEKLPGDRAALVRRLRWTPADGEVVSELQLYAVRDGRAIVASARAPEAAFARLEPTLLELLARLDVTAPGLTGSIVRRDAEPPTRTYEAFEAGRLTTTIADAFSLGAGGGEDAEEAPPDETRAWEEVRTAWENGRETP